MGKPIIHKQVSNEQRQTHETRKSLFVGLEKELQRPVITFFTSFTQPVMIEDADADMLEGVLRKTDLSKGLALIISSPGGSGLAAERIINICRSYSGTKEYFAVVPGKAKSAATMICLGASKIMMGSSSELGPIDPQVTLTEDNRAKIFSAFNLVESYNELFSKAVKEKGNLQPYLQQLANYDEREIKEMKSAMALSEDIAVRTLLSGMMVGKSETEIKKKIDIFLTPKRTKTHGRPIYREEASECCGLNIESVDVKSKFWELAYELYYRTNNYVSSSFAKCIESKEHSFAAGIRKG